MLAILCFAFHVIPALGSSWERKRSKSDRDINAIGHRTLTAHGQNFYSSAKEKAAGDLGANFGNATDLLGDPTITSYVQDVAERIARFSDATIPITVHILDRSDVVTFTGMGGHQFVSRGALARLQSEGELASLLARGIAHTALHSAAIESTQEMLMHVASVPTISFSGPLVPQDTSMANELGLLKFVRAYESDADYFGIQYLYKAGYDAHCFLSMLERIWPVSSHQVATAFSSFPALGDRLAALHQEISQILPKRGGEATSTPEFDEFQKRLQRLGPPGFPTEPLLIRHPTT